MKRVLIANRGEIAVRIIRACHEEGLEAVAVYSEADRLSPHVRAADIAVEIGPAPARESYLSIEKLLDAAKRTAADAIHPGYGFLAERAPFAEAVTAAGLIFVGPSADAIRAMGEKTEARRRMQAAGVPVVPGTVEPLTDAQEAARVAEEIGYPVMLKAAAGGGGKGMRRVERKDALAGAFKQAASEAQSAFGDASVYLEKFVERPRHVEIQVIADRYGHTMHLGERECSVQRRHQKLIEESPSPAVDVELRSAMGRAAVEAAKAVGYVSAGTVEFLLAPDRSFYFLEMNTRIQVEHPVTELVYGVDLVREQLRVARGDPLTLPGRPLAPRGHAIECRITSEDPFANFMPATGRVSYLHIPNGPGVRWDGGIDVGSEVGLSYDPLLGKLIVWAESRAGALARMRRALDEMVVAGVSTCQAFHRKVMDEPMFVRGAYDIGYLEGDGAAMLHDHPERASLESVAVAAALAEHAARGVAHPLAVESARGAESAWLIAARRAGLQ